MVHRLVAALILQGDRILLGKRSAGRAFFPNVWDVFGGHIELAEQPLQTLIRELREELDIMPTRWMELETIRESVPERDNKPSHDLFVHFYCVPGWTGKPINRQPEEHSVIQWFSYAEAVKLNLAHSSYPGLFAQCLQSITDKRQ